MIPRAPKVSQRAPKVSQKGAKGSQKGAKGSPKGAKGSQKGAKRRQRGAKSEPKGDQNASKNRSSEKVAKREPKRHAAGLFLGAIWEPFSIKNEIKIYANICVEKVMKINEKTMRT